MNERATELCAGFADGSLSDAECAELLAIAEFDPEVANALADELELHRQLQLSAGVFPIDDRTNAERILYYVRAQSETSEFSRRVGERIREDQRAASTSDSAAAARSRMEGGRRPSSSKHRRMRRRRQQLNSSWTVAALAAAIALCATIYFARGVHRPGIPVPSEQPVSVAQAMGRVVHVVAEEGSPSSPVMLRNGSIVAVRANAPLEVGDRIETRGGVVTVQYLSDGTTLELQANAIVVFEGESGGKTVRLGQGELDGTIAKQPVGQPMRFLTQHAEATVLGTKLTLTTDERESCLKVTEGAVRFAQGSDYVTVSTGEFAVAAPGEKLVVQKSAQPAEPAVATARPMPWRINPQARSMRLSWQNVPELNRDLVRVEYSNEVNNLRAIISKSLTMKPDARQLRIRLKFVSYEPQVMLSILLTERDGSTWYMMYHKPGDFAPVPWTELVVSLTKPAKKNNELGDDHLDVDQIERVALGLSRGKAVVLLDEIIVE